MKIIDSHIHLSDRPYFNADAQNSGDQNNLPYVLDMLKKNGIVGGVVMGSAESCFDGIEGAVMNLGGIFPDHTAPPPLFSCVGINPEDLKTDPQRAVDCYAKAAELPRVVGFKLYPGYQPIYPHDPAFYPLFDLAAQLDLPVVIHTGDTAGGHGMLRYAHPLEVDVAATRFPATRFVIAHFGNPWLADAMEVARKNPGVYIDVSGLAVGQFKLCEFWQQYSDFFKYARMWMRSLGDFGKLMYGSDWPLVHMEDYISLMMRVVPSQHHSAVFYDNALGVFSRMKQML